MSTNGSDRLITRAYFHAGLNGQGVAPSAQQQADGLDTLNDVIRTEQTQALKLFLQIDLPIPLVANQATYTIKPGGDVNVTRPLQVLQGYYQDTTGTRRPIDPPLSRDEYTRLSRINQSGPSRGTSWTSSPRR